MRIAAIYCGLVAGLFVLLAPYAQGIDLLTPFLTFWGATQLPSSVGTAIWFAVPTAAILGGLLTLVIPGLGTLLLTVAGFAWIAIGVGDAELLRYELLAPAGLSLLGAVLAFIGGELAIRRRRQARRADQKPAVEWEAEESDSIGAREAALKLAPHMVRATSGRGAPLREIPLTLDDLSPSESAPRRSAQPAPGMAFEPSIGVRPQQGPDLTRKAALSPGPILPEIARTDRDRRMPVDTETSRSGPVLWLSIINSFALLIVAVAVGALLLREYPEVMPVFGKATTEVASAAPQNAETNALATSPAAMTVQPAASAQGAQFSDPYEYCGAVKTIDFVDSRYSGPSFTPDIAAALGIPANSTPDKVKWRCVDGAVYACSAFGWPACDLTPTAVQMQEFCTRNPDMKRLVAPRGIWACESGIPRLPAGSSWPVDASGFYPDAWVRVIPANLRSDG